MHTHTQTLGMRLTCKKTDYQIPKCAMMDYNPDCWKDDPIYQELQQTCSFPFVLTSPIPHTMNYYSYDTFQSHNNTNFMYRNLYFNSTKLLHASIHIFTKLAEVLRIKTVMVENMTFIL